MRVSFAADPVPPHIAKQSVTVNNLFTVDNGDLCPRASHNFCSYSRQLPLTMVGLPFPSNGGNTREQSWDNGTPFSCSGDIPIDPALSQPPVDPALLAEEGIPRVEEVRIVSLYSSG